MEPGTRDKLRTVEDEILNEYREKTEERSGRINDTGWDSVAEIRNNNSSSISGNEAVTSFESKMGNPLDLFLGEEDYYDSGFQESALDPAAETDSLTEANPRAVEEMRNFIQHNTIAAFRQLDKAKKDEERDRLLLGLAVESSRGKVTSRNRRTDLLREKIESDRAQQEGVKDLSPEGYTIYYGMQLREYSRAIRSGELIRTPYVEKHLQRVEGNMSSGRPTFLHGDLGSGKTELAITAAKHVTIERIARQEALDYCESHLLPSKEEMRDQLGRIYRQRKLFYSKALHDGDPAAVEQFSPLIISGSKDLTSQDLYVDKTLKLSKFNGKSLLEHKEDLDGLVEEWLSTHQEELDRLPEDERSEKIRIETEHIVELYKLKNQAFGTEVEKIEQPLYRAIKEGRPVIIDEVNAIPSAILISLNDILQRRPGEECYIPGEGKVEIKDGFSVTMTGNLSSNSVSYFGTNDLNPAFLSRLDIIGHDYLPMSETDNSYDEQADPSKNELFQVVMAHLVDRQGNLQLPEMEHSLDKLFALCQLAHESQRIFQGKWRESDMGLKSDSGDDIEPRFEKSVLSIRNLLNILQEWDKGSEKDIDMALWDGFISNMTNPDDQNFMLAIAARYGFFQRSEGWDIKIRGRGASFTSLEEIHPGPIDFQREPLETLSMMDTVDAIFGPRPEREVYPEINFDELDKLNEEVVSIEDLDDAQEKIRELKTTIDAMEVLYDQCGCNVPEAVA